MEQLKKGDYVEFIGSQEEEWQKTICTSEEVCEGENPLEHVGRIATVIGDNSYLVITARPCAGYKIIIGNAQIIRKLSEDEVSDVDDLCSFDADSAGLKIYTCEEEPMGDCLKEKCRSLVEEAMKGLLPEETVESMRMVRSDFLKSNLLKCVDRCLDRHGSGHDSTMSNALKTKRDDFEVMLHQKRFREYYSLAVDLASGKNYLVAVSTDLREVVIPRDKFELSGFVDSLGPEFASVFKHKKELCREIIMM
jgi:hypothetical protein